MGLEQPNWYGYNDFDEIIEAMDMYIQGVEDVSGGVVLKVPPKPPREVPRGLEEVATYLYSVSLGDVEAQVRSLNSQHPPTVCAYQSMSHIVRTSVGASIRVTFLLRSLVKLVDFVHR